MAKGTADTTLVKQGYAKLAYTPDTMEDFTNCADPYDGALYFMTNHVKIQHPTKGKMFFNLYPFQEKVLEYSSFLDHQAKNPTEILDFIFYSFLQSI